jgi:hypothetical protein
MMQAAGAAFDEVPFVHLYLGFGHPVEYCRLAGSCLLAQ